MWNEEGDGVEVVSFAFLAWKARRGEEFEDVSHTGLHPAARPRPSICQRASCVSRDLHMCY